MFTKISHATRAPKGTGKTALTMVKKAAVKINKTVSPLKAKNSKRGYKNL
jgi:hypothetical protein